MLKRHSFLLLIIITILGAYLRFNHFLVSPPAFHIDESDIAYQAYSIFKTGRDYHGNFLPVHPQSFTDRRPFLYMLVLIPFIAIFGLNEFTIRLAPALFGAVTIPLIYLLAKNLFPSQNIKNKIYFGLLAATILSVLPWHIHYSRVGYELTFMLFTLTLGLLFITRFLNEDSFVSLILGVIFLILTIYVYSTAKLFIPLLILCISLIYRHKLQALPKRSTILILFITTLILTPLVRDTILGVGKERFAILSIFNDENGLAEYLHYRWLSTYSQHFFPFYEIHPATLSKIFLNDGVSVFYRFLGSYFSPFSPQFLIFSGDPNQRHVNTASGVASLTITFLFIVGLVNLLTSAKTNFKYLSIILLLLSPLPSAITREGAFHATRMFFFILPLSLISAYGFYCFLTKRGQLISYLLILLIFLSLTWEVFRDQFLRLTVYPIHAYNSYNYGWKELVSKVDKYSNNYKYIIIDNSEGSPIQTLYAFFKKTDPRVFQKYSKQVLGKYSDDNVVFKNINPLEISERFSEKDLLIFQKALLEKHNLSIRDIKNAKILEVIKSPTGEDFFYFGRAETPLGGDAAD